jgi:hypothetical protein
MTLALSFKIASGKDWKVSSNVINLLNPQHMESPPLEASAKEKFDMLFGLLKGYFNQMVDNSFWARDGSGVGFRLADHFRERT